MHHTAFNTPGFAANTSHFPTFGNTNLIALTQWQYWWWFWFTFLLTLYFVLTLRILYTRTLSLHPKITTSLRSHGRWGDLIICAVPIFWCLNILTNSHFLLRHLEWQTENSLFTLRVRGKQWYWVYKFDLKGHYDVNTAHVILGRNKKIQAIRSDPTKWSLMTLGPISRYTLRDRVSDPLSKVNSIAVRAKNPNLYIRFQLDEVSKRFISFVTEHLLTVKKNLLGGAASDQSTEGGESNHQQSNNNGGSDNPKKNNNGLDGGELVRISSVRKLSLLIKIRAIVTRIVFKPKPMVEQRTILVKSLAARSLWRALRTSPIKLPRNIFSQIVVNHLNAELATATAIKDSAPYISLDHLDQARKLPVIQDFVAAYINYLINNTRLKLFYQNQQANGYVLELYRRHCDEVEAAIERVVAKSIKPCKPHTSGKTFKKSLGEMGSPKAIRRRSATVTKCYQQAFKPYFVKRAKKLQLQGAVRRIIRRRIERMEIKVKTLEKIKFIFITRSLAGLETKLPPRIVRRIVGTTRGLIADQLQPLDKHFISHQLQRLRKNMYIYQKNPGLFLVEDKDLKAYKVFETYFAELLKLRVRQATNNHLNKKLFDKLRPNNLLLKLPRFISDRYNYQGVKVKRRILRYWIRGRALTLETKIEQSLAILWNYLLPAYHRPAEEARWVIDDHFDWYFRNTVRAAFNARIVAMQRECRILKMRQAKITATMNFLLRQAEALDREGIGGPIFTAIWNHNIEPLFEKREQLAKDFVKMTFDEMHVRKMRKALIQTKLLEDLRDRTSRAIAQRMYNRLRAPAMIRDKVILSLNKEFQKVGNRHVLRNLTTLILERRLLPILAKLPQSYSLSADGQSALMRYRTYLAALVVVSGCEKRKLVKLYSAKQSMMLMLARRILKPDPAIPAIKKRIQAQVVELGWREFLSKEFTKYVKSTNVAKVNTLVKQFQKYNRIKKIALRTVVIAAADQRTLQYLLGSDNGLLPRDLYVLPRSFSEAQRALHVTMTRPILPKPIVTKSTLMKLILRQLVMKRRLNEIYLENVRRLARRKFLFWIYKGDVTKRDVVARQFSLHLRDMAALALRKRFFNFYKSIVVGFTVRKHLVGFSKKDSIGLIVRHRIFNIYKKSKLKFRVRARLINLMKKQKPTYIETEVVVNRPMVQWMKALRSDILCLQNFRRLWKNEIRTVITPRIEAEHQASLQSAAQRACTARNRTACQLKARASRKALLQLVVVNKVHLRLLVLPLQRQVREEWLLSLLKTLGGGKKKVTQSTSPGGTTSSTGYRGGSHQQHTLYRCAAVRWEIRKNAIVHRLVDDIVDALDYRNQLSREVLVVSQRPTPWLTKPITQKLHALLQRKHLYTKYGYLGVNLTRVQDVIVRAASQAIRIRVQDRPTQLAYYLGNPNPLTLVNFHDVRQILYPNLYSSTYSSRYTTLPELTLSAFLKQRAVAVKPLGSQVERILNKAKTTRLPSNNPLTWVNLYYPILSKRGVLVLKPLSKHRWIKNKFTPNNLIQLFRYNKEGALRSKQLLRFKFTSDTDQIRDLNNNTRITYIQKKNEPVTFTTGLDKYETVFDNKNLYREFDTVVTGSENIEYQKIRIRKDKENLLTVKKRQAYRREIQHSKRLLWVTKQIILPIRTPITIITNSYDVIHSWFIPGLGLKMDCVPGRSTHHTIFVDKPGYYYGQCAEVCGRRHHHMPIKILAVPFVHFLYWWNKRVRGRIEEELNTRRG